MAVPSQKFLLTMIGVTRRSACVEIAATVGRMLGASCVNHPLAILGEGFAGREAWGPSSPFLHGRESTQWTPTKNFAFAFTSRGGRWKTSSASSDRAVPGRWPNVLAPGPAAAGAGLSCSGCLSERKSQSPRVTCRRRVTTRAVESTTSARAAARRQPGPRRSTSRRSRLRKKGMRMSADGADFRGIGVRGHERRLLDEPIQPHPLNPRCPAALFWPRGRIKPTSGAGRRRSAPAARASRSRGNQTSRRP